MPHCAEPLAAVLLAAGAARRMRGADKTLELIAGEPVLRRTARALLAAGLPVTVVLPPDAPARAAALDGLAVAVVVAPDATEGMGASLRSGAAAAPAGHALLVALADMPGLEAADFAALAAAAAAHPGRCLRATDAAGRGGHPVVLPARLRPALARLSGDAGARAILDAEAVLGVPLPDDRATTDLDTPEAWAAWRARCP